MVSSSTEEAPVEVAEATEETPVAGDATAEAAEAESNGKEWYIIHTYSGFEGKVAEGLMSRVQMYNLQDEIGQILIPTEDVVEMKGGKKVVTSKLFFPGYVLVEMKMTDETWYLVRNTPKVTGFVGQGSKPTPLTEAEVNEVVHRVSSADEKPKPRFIYDRGETVKVIDGPFANFTGEVEEVNLERSTVKVMVTIFGRATPVELEFIQVEKM